jgi:uncharacterized protein (TIGR00290 family)
MPEKERVVVSWSGGKDSALALHELRKSDRYQIVALLTTVAEQYRRVSHHGVRETLLRMQAEAIGLPLDTLYLPSGPSDTCTFEQYEELMGRKMAEYRGAGVMRVVHGDIFLEDLREYRQRNLAKLKMEGLFPIWQRDTTELIRAFTELGFRAYVTCVDAEKLPASFVGRQIDAGFVRDLPEGVDPCGENGEYHSFVYAGPIFHRPLRVEVGEIVSRDGRHFADLLPSGDSTLPPG